MYGNRGTSNLLWGQEEKAGDPTWGLCIREDFLELVTFSKAMTYKQVFEDGEKGRKDIPPSEDRRWLIGASYLCECER